MLILAMKEWFKKYWLVISIGLLAFLPFSVTLFDPFVSDDWDFLYSARHDGFSISQILTTNNEGNYEGGSYRPMVPIFWRGLYRIFQLHPLGYHTMTIGFHIANTLLLFFLIKKISKKLGNSTRIAAIASIVFAISPSRGEIAWVSVVNDTLVVLYILFTFYTFFMSLEAQTKIKRYSFFVLSLIFTFCAFLTKEVALIIPPTIFVLTFVFGWFRDKKFVLRFLYSAGIAFVYGCIVVVFFALRYRMIGFLFADYTGDIVLTSYHVIRAVVSYTFGFFVSGQIRTDISYFFIRHFELFIILLAALIGVFLYSIRRTKVLLPLVLVLLLFGCSLVPIIRFGVNVTPHYISEEGQRYLYLPSIFLSFFIALLLSSWFERYTKKIRTYFLVCAVLCGLLLYVQLFVQTSHFHHAALVADNLLHVARNIIEKGDYDGYVVVGLPDQYRGAPIFRNAFDQALSLLLRDETLPFTRLIVSRNRTLYDPENSEFLVSRVNENTFTYTQLHNLPFISSAESFVSHDYTTYLHNYQKQSYALSVFDVGTSLSFIVSDEFVSSNKQIGNSIAYLFFSQGRWKVVGL